MREFYNGFDVFEIIRKNKDEEYLYMTQEELFQKKLKIDERIIDWKGDCEKVKQFPFDNFYPDPSAVYAFSLIECAVISIVISYKFRNLEKLESKCTIHEENPEIYEMLITAIKEDPKISYFDLIDLGTEKDEFEMYLEKLIEDKIISRRGKYNNKYWKVNKNKL